MVNAVDASSHKRHRGIAAIIARGWLLLRGMRDAGKLSSFDINAFLSSGRVLHNDFYYPRRSERHMLSHIRDTRALVERLLAAR